MLSLVHNLHKQITEHQDEQNFWQCICAICNLYLCCNFALMLHEKCNCFHSITDVHSFFLNIVNSEPSVLWNASLLTA